MNFISHYYCAQSQDPYYSLGVLLPDIIPHFSKLYNLYFAKYDIEKLNNEERNLISGIFQHYADDTFFHTMPLFKHFNKRIDEEIISNSVLSSIQRKFLVSHVLYELILDNMILDKYPEMAHDIYGKMDKIDLNILDGFFQKIIGETQEIPVYLDSYTYFLNRRFLNFYSMESNLVKALHFVTGKIGKWEYEPNTIREFTTIINKIKTEINFEDTFHIIKSQNR